MKLPRYNPKRARIEIVPMIDTIFFLLVYFIIACLNTTRLAAPHVALPESATAAAAARADDQVVVTVDPKGRCFVDQQQIAEADLGPTLTQRLQTHPSLTVVINCDRSQPIARFGRVFDIVKQANAASVMVATTPAGSWGTRQ